MKNTLGKSTFLLICISVILYIFITIASIWSLSVSFDGWGNIVNMSISMGMGNYFLVKMIGENFVIPFIVCMVSLWYLIVIGQGKRIERPVYMITALALLVEMIFFIYRMINSYYMQSSEYYHYSVPITQFIIRVGFLLAFILLFTDNSRQVLKKPIYLILGCSYAGAVAFLIISLKNSLSALLQYQETEQGLILLYGYTEDFLFPVVSILTCGLLIGYILFPERYLEA